MDKFPLNNNFAGRNLLNKKENPPSAIKESSESSQTIDETESGVEKGKNNPSRGLYASAFM